MNSQSRRKSRASAEFSEMTRLLLSCAVLFVVTSAYSQAPSNGIDVPFTFVRNQIIVLDVTINDKGPFKMLLDTGADVPFIDVSLARELGLKIGTKSTRIVSPGDPKGKGYDTTLPLVRIGAPEATNVKALVEEDSPEYKPITEVQVRGTLGHSFLKQWVVQIDYPNHVVRFLSQLPPDRPGDVKLDFHNVLLIDDVRVNGTTTSAKIDTGFDFPFGLLPKAIKSLSLEKDPNPLTELTSVSLGSLSVQHVPALYLRDFTEFSWGLNIGNIFLRDYILTIDYPRQVLVLRPAALLPK